MYWHQPRTLVITIHICVHICVYIFMCWKSATACSYIGTYVGWLSAPIHIYIYIHMNIHMYGNHESSWLNSWHVVSDYEHIFDNKLQPTVDRVAQNLEIISRNLHLVPGIPGFSWDLLLISCYYLVLIVNPMCRMLVRRRLDRSNLNILCHPICIGLHVLIFYHICWY